MTRKQALQRAIEALSTNPEYAEDIRILQEIKDELPLIHWSDSSIRDAVEQFILDNNRVPTVTDFKRKGMPPHPVIKQKYKITLAEWLEKNYPVSKVSQEELKEKYTKLFIEEYNRIKPNTKKEFELNRNPATKSWYTVAKYHGLKSWRELIRKLDLPSYSAPTNRVSPVITVNIYSDYDFSDQ